MIVPFHMRAAHRIGSRIAPHAASFALLIARRRANAAARLPDSLASMLAPREPRRAPSAHGRACIYHAYQTHSDLLWPLRIGGAKRLCPRSRARATSPGEDVGAAQARRGVRGVRARGAHARAPAVSASTRSPSATATVAVIEEVALRTPFATLLHFRKDDARSGAARADRRADVRPLRHAAARHRAHDARRPRRLHHRLAQRARRAARRPAASASTSTSST